MANQNSNLSADAVWLVTGCSSGIGAGFATHIAKSGQRIVATARNPDTLKYLPDAPNVLKLKLDVTSPSNISSVVAAAVSEFGRIDVLVNNAGYCIMGDFESIPDLDARKEFETNFWGPINMTREVLHVFREVNPKGVGGTVVQITSMGGYVGYPGQAFYHASKFALEGATEGIAKEMHPDWNIHFMVVEPGGVKTEYTGSMIHAERHPAYSSDDMPTSQLLSYVKNPDSAATWANAADVARTVFDVVSHKGDRALPFRLPLGSDAYSSIVSENETNSSQIEEWKSVIESVSNR